MLHHVSDHWFDFRSIRDGRKTHIVVPDTIRYEAGDRLHIADTGTGTEVYRTVLTVGPATYISHGWSVVGLLQPELSRLRQLVLTNECGQTSVFWVGDTRELKVGRSLRLHDDMHDWRIDSLWIALPPKYVPTVARIGFVQEIL